MNRIDKSIVNLKKDMISNSEIYNEFFELISSFGKNEIDSMEMFSNLTKSEMNILYKLLTKVITFKEYGKRTYIELPQDVFFNHNSNNIFESSKEVIGITNNYFIYNERLKSKNNYAEISVPSSVDTYELKEKDWIKIIKKNPYLYIDIYNKTMADFDLNYRFDHMTKVEFRVSVNRHLDRIESRCEEQMLKDEEIEQIEFVYPQLKYNCEELATNNIKIKALK